MTLEEFHALMVSTGLPVAYHHFATPQKPPFIAWYSEGYEGMPADGKLYHHDTAIRIELYAEHKDQVSEGKIETALADFYFSKDETYIEEEHLFETIYSLEV